MQATNAILDQVNVMIKVGKEDNISFAKLLQNYKVYR